MRDMVSSIAKRKALQRLLRGKLDLRSRAFAFLSCDERLRCGGGGGGGCGDGELPDTHWE